VVRPRLRLGVSRQPHAEYPCVHDRHRYLGVPRAPARGARATRLGRRLRAENPQHADELGDIVTSGTTIFGDSAGATYERELDQGPGGRSRRDRDRRRSRKIEEGATGSARCGSRSRRPWRRSRGHASASTTSARQTLERSGDANDIRVGSSTDGLTPVSVAVAGRGRTSGPDWHS
jgi:hypothetical protein